MVQAVRATANQVEAYLTPPGNNRVTATQLEAYGSITDRPVRITALQVEAYYSVNPEGTPSRRQTMDAILAR